MTPLQAYLNSPKARRALSKKPGEEGFSLIELVVVVAVLAVLSAIAIPSFNNISGKARASAAANTLATVAKECAAKIADVGESNAEHNVPSADGYRPTATSTTIGFFLNGDVQTAGTQIGCDADGVIELRSENTEQYPTWVYDMDTGAKTCSATGTALNRGCTGGAW